MDSSPAPGDLHDHSNSGSPALLPRMKKLRPCCVSVNIADAAAGVRSNIYYGTRLLHTREIPAVQLPGARSASADPADEWRCTVTPAIATAMTAGARAMNGKAPRSWSATVRKDIEDRPMDDTL